MDWIELSVDTTREAADAVSDRLMSYGAKGTQILDRADVPTLAELPGYGELIGSDLAGGLPETVQVKAWFASLQEAGDAQQALASLESGEGLDFGSLAVGSRSVADEDWAENWKRHYKPFRAGGRLSPETW